MEMPFRRELTWREKANRFVEELTSDELISQDENHDAVWICFTQEQNSKFGIRLNTS